LFDLDLLLIVRVIKRLLNKFGDLIRSKREKKMLLRYLWKPLYTEIAYKKDWTNCKV